MKRILVVLLLTSALCQGQDTITYKYLDIMVITKAIGTTFTAMASKGGNVFIDFGFGEFYTPDNPYKDESGNTIFLNSILEAINYFSKAGWKYEQVYVHEQAAGSSFERHITHALMKKPLFKK